MDFCCELGIKISLILLIIDSTLIFNNGLYTVFLSFGKKLDFRTTFRKKFRFSAIYSPLVLGELLWPPRHHSPLGFVENGWAHSVPWEKALNNNCFATISTQQLPPNTKMESDLFWSCIKILLNLRIDTVGLTTRLVVSTYLVWNNLKAKSNIHKFFEPIVHH